MYFDKEEIRDQLLKKLLNDEDTAENQRAMHSNTDEPDDDFYKKKRAAFAERVSNWEREPTREPFVGFSGKNASRFMPLEIRMERR